MQLTELKSAIQVAAKKLFDTDIEPELNRPDEQFGDYATNVALQLAKKAAKAPAEIARGLIEELKTTPGIEQVSSAGPGFINFKLTDEALGKMALTATDLPKLSAGQEVLVEFGDPNPFKEMHIGHLYSYIVGDSISKILKAAGAEVKQLSYHGDVGLQVAKAIYGMQKLEADKPAEDFLGAAYAYGSKMYEDDQAAKAEIEAINQHVYAQDDPVINKLYAQGREQSFNNFDKILNLLSISTDKRYLESQTAEPGKELVEKNVGKVFKQSQGAIIFEGEKLGLHTRVFITSKGLPTYETKDLGLVILKDKDYPSASRSIVITANEQSEYFKVMLAALAEIDADLAKITTHLSHGFLSLSSGKMNSREGNVYAAMDLLLAVKAAVHEQYPDSPVRKDMTFAAVKYAFLKHRLGSDIIFDIKESISLDGNSGPYLQYAHARASSILAKDEAKDSQPTDMKFDANERSLARKISEYPEVVEKSINELMPHHIANYLYELAQAFNRFYETSRIIGDERAVLRLQLVKAYQQVLANGLDILNITAPDRM